MVTEGHHLLEIRRQTRIETGLCKADPPCLTRYGLDTDFCAALCEAPRSGPVQAQVYGLGGGSSADADRQ